MACNFLDKINGNKTDLHDDLNTCKDLCDGSGIGYICKSMLRKFFCLNYIKIEGEYRRG